MSTTARDKAWTPTTDDVMRWFSPPPAHVVPQMPDEQFSDYLARISIRSFEAEIDSEQAARRWLAEHDAEIRAAACASVLSALTEEDSRALDRRITAAIYNTSISRAELQFELPECHKAKCQSTHPDGSAALSMMMRAISENVRREVLYRTVTMPDVADEDDPERAVLTLAALLSTYNVHDAGTYIRAAQLIIDAYPLIGAALIEQETTK